MGAYWNESGRVIAKVMAAGGPIRQILNEKDLAPDVWSWQGKPGVEVATGLVEDVMSVSGIETDARFTAIEALAGRLAAATVNNPHSR